MVLFLLWCICCNSYCTDRLIKTPGKNVNDGSVMLIATVPFSLMLFVFRAVLLMVKLKYTHKIQVIKIKSFWAKGSVRLSHFIKCKYYDFIKICVHCSFDCFLHVISNTFKACFVPLMRVKPNNHMKNVKNANG